MGVIYMEDALYGYHNVDTASYRECPRSYFGDYDSIKKLKLEKLMKLSQLLGVIIVYIIVNASGDFDIPFLVCMIINFAGFVMTLLIP